jgi:hypothetical protein
MGREDIIRMARECQFAHYYESGDLVAMPQLERFAALVAAEKEKQIIDMLERLQERNESHNYYAYAINVIRARSEK